MGVWLGRGGAALASAALAFFISARLAGGARDLLGPLMSADAAEAFERAVFIAFAAPGVLGLFAVALYGAAARLRGPEGPDELAHQSAFVTAAGTGLFLLGRAVWGAALMGPGSVLWGHPLGYALVGAGVTVWFLAGGVALRAWLDTPHLLRALSPSILRAGATQWTRGDLAAGGTAAILGVLAVSAGMAPPIAMGALELASLAWSARRARV